MTVIYGATDDIRKWVSLHIFGCDDGFDEKTESIAAVKDGKIIAAVTYHSFQPNHSVEMSIASVDKRWATRHNLRAFFKYPFIDLRVKRVQTLCSAKEDGVILFNQRLGFKPEGYHRCAWHDGGDAISFGMLKDECRWING